jgi:hypothetical protein
MTTFTFTPTTTKRPERERGAWLNLRKGPDMTQTLNSPKPTTSKRRTKAFVPTAKDDLSAIREACAGAERGRALLLWNTLEEYANRLGREFRMPQKVVAEQAGMTPPAVRSAIVTLARLGLLQVETGGTGKKVTTIWTCLGAELASTNRLSYEEPASTNRPNSARSNRLSPTRAQDYSAVKEQEQRKERLVSDSATPELPLVEAALKYVAGRFETQQGFPQPPSTEKDRASMRKLLGRFPETAEAKAALATALDYAFVSPFFSGQVVDVPSLERNLAKLLSASKASTVSNNTAERVDRPASTGIRIAR